MSVARRSFLKLGAAAAIAPGLTPWRKVLAGPAVVGKSPYGALGAPDASGVALPSGFTAKLLARTGDAVGSSGYAWHGAPDGGACFEHADGWVYVSNSELNGRAAASACSGSIVTARSLRPTRSSLAPSGTAPAAPRSG
jgi:hypothetical protein